MSSWPVTVLDILLVEDDPGDELLTREALEDQGAAHRVHVAHDGQEAIDFLYRLGDHENAPHPDLILLDLNLPKFSGHQILERIKEDPDLAQIPVVILSTSQAQKDIADSSRLGANAYISKPVDLDRYTRVVQQIDGFFAGLVRLPPRSLNESRRPRLSLVSWVAGPDGPTRSDSQEPSWTSRRSLSGSCRNWSPATRDRAWITSAKHVCGRWTSTG
jgi:CheY-like chemotaxis protein